LESVVTEDNPKIIPEAQDFKEELRKTLQRRIDDKKNKPQNRRLFWPPFYRVPDEQEIPENKP
jgi:hypothetical protein